ncbi:MAG: universal stress protein UspA [Legionella sp.]|nr:MAG: universal stress protein UspA [Legionella sp.]PJD98941.1 MAG: universal stress protein UspA [Legionella sp.]
MYHRILCATDLLSQHESLIEKAVLMSQHLNATLYLLHVIELPASYQLAQGLGFTELLNPAKDDAQTVLSMLGEQFNIPVTQQLVEVGSVREIIFQQVIALQCDLIMIGSRSEHGIEALLGSTAHAITNRAPCDVLTLRV